MLVQISINMLQEKMLVKLSIQRFDHKMDMKAYLKHSQCQRKGNID